MDASTFWDEKYRASEELFGAEPNAMVVALTHGLPAGRALDLGAGEGRNAVWLAQNGHDVTAVDVSKVAVERTTSLASSLGVGVEAICADLIHYTPLAAAYDLVLLSYLQLPEESRRVVHARAVDALAPGGRLVLVAHHRDNLEHGYGGPPSAEVLFDEEQLRIDFAGLDIVRCEQASRVVCLGAENQSTAIDIVCVALLPLEAG